MQKCGQVYSSKRAERLLRYQVIELMALRTVTKLSVENERTHSFLHATKPSECNNVLSNFPKNMMSAAAYYLDENFG